MNSGKLKIGIVCYPTFGGSGVVATEIGTAMAQRGHEVHFISYDVPRRLERFQENVYFHEVEVRENPVFAHPPYTLTLTSEIVDVATYQKLDLLHVHYAVPHATSAYLARKIMGTTVPKVITTLHGTDITLVGAERSYLPVTRFSIMESDGVTVPSKFLREATYSKLNIPTSQRIEVIPNFVDTELFKPRAEDCPRKLVAKCTSKERVLIHISNFRPVKRVTDVVKIFELVNNECPARLILVGDGPERSNVEALVRELKLADRVSFLGKQESLVEILQNCDLFLLPSQNESFGLAALEAMSCGLPVVASNAEGIPEVVANGQTGLLSGVGDVADMATSCLKLLRDSELHRQFSRASRKRVEELFNRDQVISKYEEFYLTVLDTPGRLSDSVPQNL